MTLAGLAGSIHQMDHCQVEVLGTVGLNYDLPLPVEPNPTLRGQAAFPLSMFIDLNFEVNVRIFWGPTQRSGQRMQSIPPKDNVNPPAAFH